MDYAQIAQDIAARYIPPDTGRPCAIGNPQTVAELLKAVDDGNYYETAAELAGVSTDSLRRWMKLGEAGQEPFTLFCAALKRAERRAEALAVARVRQAGTDPRFWAAEMTFLERRHPERWARRSEGDTGPKVIVQIGASADDLRVHLQITGNDNAGYQTQMLGEGQSLQALAAPWNGATEAKGEGRKLLPVASPDVLARAPVLALGPFEGPQPGRVPGTGAEPNLVTNGAGKEKKRRKAKC